MKTSTTRNICLDILAYMAVGTMLVIGAISEWRSGNKLIGALSGFVAFCMFWHAWEGTQTHLIPPVPFNPNIQNNATDQQSNVNNSTLKP